MRTFAQIGQDESVKATEVARLLKDYATSGSSITANVVIDLINRIKPNEVERAEMKASAQTGRAKQTELGHYRLAKEYGEVVRLLS